MDKVVNALEYLISGDCCDTQFDYVDEIQQAINLLKGKAPVKPEKKDPLSVRVRYDYCCKECDAPMLFGQPYCMGCGRMVAWDA